MTYPEALNRQRMSLNFEYFFKRIPQDLNGTRSVIFSNSSKECSSPVHQCELTDVYASFVLHLLFSILDFSQNFVCAHSVASAFAIRFICYPIEVHILGLEFKYWLAIVFLLISCLARSSVQFPHEHAAIPSARDEARVVI